MQASTFDVEWWDITRPTPYARNARVISDAAVAKVAASLTEFGWRQPIVVDEHGVILAGHCRLRAAQKLGMTEVPVHIASGLTVQKAKAFRLLDNRSAQEATWDDPLLKLELQELDDLGLDLERMTGFDETEIDRLLSDDDGSATSGSGAGVDIHSMYEIAVTCADEQAQRALYARLSAEGYSVRVLTI